MEEVVENEEVVVMMMTLVTKINDFENIQFCNKIEKGTKARKAKVANILTAVFPLYDHDQC